MAGDDDEDQYQRQGQGQRQKRMTWVQQQERRLYDKKGGMIYFR